MATAELPRAARQMVSLAVRNHDDERHARVHAEMMQVTAGAPRKVILINDEPYLERYYVGEVPGVGGKVCQHWLHRFLRADAERHLHVHPWQATALVLTGWYLEERGGGEFRILTPGDVNAISFETLHRVAAVMPDTWTSLLVKPERLDTWAFVDEHGERQEQRTSGIDWWKAYGPREVQA